jgi:hypothetical protein
MMEATLLIALMKGPLVFTKVTSQFLGSQNFLEWGFVGPRFNGYAPAFFCPSPSHRVDGRSLTIEHTGYVRGVGPRRPFVIGQSGQIQPFSNPIFPTRFPTELLTTGWEMAGLDGWRLVKNA